MRHRSNSYRILALSLVLLAATTSCVCAQPSEETSMSLEHEILESPTERKEQLEALRCLWKEKCHHWKHCDGKTCRYDLAGGFDKTSFQLFLFDMEMNTRSLMRKVERLRAEDEKLRKDRNSPVPSQGELQSLQVNVLNQRLDCRKLVSAFSTCFPSSFVRNFAKAIPSKSSPVRSLVEHSKPPIIPEGDYIRETEDSKIRNMLKQRLEGNPSPPRDL